MLRKHYVAIPALLLTAHAYGSTFSYLMYATGALFTGVAFNEVRNTLNTNTVEGMQEADQTTCTYVRNCAEHMPSVNLEDIRSIKVYVARTHDVQAHPEAALTQDPLSNYVLILENFEVGNGILADTPRHNLQYMMLAHEFKHFYNEDYIRLSRLYKVMPLLSTYVYPCVAYGTTELISQPYSRAAAFPVVATLALFGQVVSFKAILGYQFRRAERDADMFALRQARSLADIEAQYNDFKAATESQTHLFTWFATTLGYIVRKHPLPHERMCYVGDYYRKKQAEGWTQ